MRGCLYYVTNSYEWDLGKIDNEAFIPVGCLVHMLQVCWENQSSKNSEFNILFPARPLLSLFLLVDNSDDFEQWACISPMNWAWFVHNIHVEVAKGDRSVLDVFLRATDVQPLVRTMIFENAWVTHVRNKKRHTILLFH